MFWFKVTVGRLYSSYYKNQILTLYEPTATFKPMTCSVGSQTITAKLVDSGKQGGSKLHEYYCFIEHTSLSCILYWFGSSGNV